MFKITYFLSGIKKRLGLIFLVIILLIINLKSLKPQFYFLGWDNYSSYFNQKTNLFRTFFSTWREYRGLGVPSDAEVTDFFRQIFFCIFMPIFGEKLIDQIYFLATLNSGVLLIYFLARKIYNQYLKIRFKINFADLFGFSAGFFYLFNLNTYGHFYGPIIPYNNRFFSLPLLFLIFLDLGSRTKIKLGTYLVYIAAIFMTSGSYVTPTIFITVTLALGIFLATQQNLKKNLLLFIFFLLINSFWLLPFLNYAKEKAKLMPFASTFREINENTLNRSKASYLLKNQLLFIPLTFEMNFINKITNQKQSIHSLAMLKDQKLPSTILYIFPICYLIGFFAIWLNFKKNKKIIWIPLLIIIFLFLSLNEYSFLGFIYTWFSKTIPFFKIVFRMADAKFHSFLLFGACFSSAYFILLLVNLLLKINSRRIFFLSWSVLLSLIFIPNIIIFNNYFKGNLFGFFMYNKIPSQYFDLAKTINNDPEEFRVLNLPIERDQYWQTYTWGYIGSAFFHYFLDKPYIDKTFEPASMENTYLNQKLFNLLMSFYESEKDFERQNKAKEFYHLLKTLGVKYIILDKTRSVDVYSRGIIYEGRPLTVYSQSLLQYLEKAGLVKIKNEYKINLNDYLNAYQNLEPLNGKNLPPLTNPQQEIILYQMMDYNPKISFLDQASFVDPKLSNILAIEVQPFKTDILQSQKENQGALYPFLRNDFATEIGPKQIKLIFPQTSLNGEYLVNITTNEQEAHLINLYTSIKDNILKIKFKEEYLPNVNDYQFSLNLGEIVFDLNNLNFNKEKILKDTHILADWNYLNKNLSAQLRLKINEVTIPLPINEREEYLTSILVHGSQINLQILNRDRKIAVPSQNVFPLSPQACYSNNLPDYAGNLVNNSLLSKITVKNGSMCAGVSISPLLNEKTNYLEFKLNVKADHQNLESLTNENKLFTSKPKLQEVVKEMEKPAFLRFCLKEDLIETCFNKHQIANISKPATWLIPSEYTIASNPNLIFQIALISTGLQQAEAELSNIELELFKPVFEQSLEIEENLDSISKISFTQKQNLEIVFPKIISKYGFLMDINWEGFHHGLNYLCPLSTGWHTLRIFNNNIVSYFENCDQVLAQHIPYNSRNFILWLITYNLLSGQQPNLIINDKNNIYFLERASLYQGYPNLTGFKLFQSPEFFQTKAKILKNLNKLEMHTAGILLPPKTELNDLKEKYFNFHQASSNEAMYALQNFAVLELPQSWQTMEIKPLEEKENTYDLPSKISYKRILPSLWQLKIEMRKEGKYLLKFNEGYDRQWQIYKNLKNLILAKKASYEHYRCQGYANCFELNADENSCYYLFYTPEKLAFIGWSITLLTIFLGFKIFFKKQ